jgi:predicted LPLAT superfamily acyltransferase
LVPSDAPESKTSTVPGGPAKSCDRVGACVVIPVFNNARTVSDVVSGALKHATNVLVCDDGSTDGSGERAREAGAEVIRFPRNRGKGVALKALLGEAARRGFRYAFSIDGDGQHRPDDLPSLAEATRRQPGALIIGARNFAEAGAPPVSRFGRRFSNFWIWFETGARVEDSQCGLRAYPIPECGDLHAAGDRYEFEVQVLLKAGWAGIPMASVPVWTAYPKDRVSHFRKGADNARISVINTLACLRLLLPLPLGKALYEIPRRPGLSLFAIRRWAWLGRPGILSRVAAAALGSAAAFLYVRQGSETLFLVACAVLGLGLLPGLIATLSVRALLGEGWVGWNVVGLVLAVAAGLGVAEHFLFHKKPLPRTWTGRSYGGVLGYAFFVQVLRLSGRAVAYLFLYPVVAFFLLRARDARVTSAKYLDRAIGPSTGFERWRRTYRQFLAIGQCLIDRVVLASKGPSAFEHTHEGNEHIQRIAAAGKGGILLTAHLGNWEVASGLLRGLYEVRIAIAVFEGEEERLKRYLERMSGPIKPRVITVGSDELSVLEILRSLREGWLVAISGDRLLDGRFTRVPFLGEDAPFPVGPFILAAISGAPVIHTFALKQGPATYRFVADPPEHLAFASGRRDEQIKEWVAAYARRLEQLVREYPYQWFNFYDFWNAMPPNAAPLPPGEGSGVKGSLSPR